MKVVLFCGGQGTRMREYSERIPKPLVEVGSQPILWHLMKYYAHYGHNEFILCLGYGGRLIREYFNTYDERLSNDYVMRDGGRTFDLKNTDIDDWTITFADTGVNSSIGNRLLAVQKYLGSDERFLANYADGVSDLPLDTFVKDFLQRDNIASFVQVRMPQSYHLVTTDPNNVLTMIEPVGESAIRVNGGFFALKREIFDYLNEGEELVVEAFNRLIPKGQVIGVPHDGFWQSMDTFKDKLLLDDLVARGDAPWQVWG